MTVEHSAFWETHTGRCVRQGHECKQQLVPPSTLAPFNAAAAAQALH